MSINKLIKNRRTELGLTMKEVAYACSVTEATVSRWESGEIENMRRDKIVALSRILLLSPAELMGWKSPDSFTLTDFEKNLVIAYRQAPESRRESVRALLNIQKKGISEQDTEVSAS